MKMVMMKDSVNQPVTSHKCRHCGYDGEGLTAELAYYKDLFKLPPDFEYQEWGFTPRQARFFSVLVNKFEEPVSKDALLTAVHNASQDHYEAEPKIVDVMVCKIRKVLRGKGMHIKTIWGFGYALMEGEEEPEKVYTSELRGKVPQWSPEEDQLLRTSTTILEAASKIGRTPNAVWARANKIGHRWTNSWKKLKPTIAARA